MKIWLSRIRRAVRIQYTQNTHSKGKKSKVFKNCNRFEIHKHVIHCASYHGENDVHHYGNVSVVHQTKQQKIHLRCIELTFLMYSFILVNITMII